MRAVITKGPKGWHGATDDDEATFQKMRARMKSAKPGSWMRMETTRLREGWMHRKLFALFNLITENSETYDTIEKALVAIKLCVGHFDMVVDPTTGEVLKAPRSISYENMEQDEFERFYAQAIDGVLEHIVPQFERQQALDLLDTIVDGWVTSYR